LSPIGGDNRSRLTASQVKSEVLESDLQLYAIGTFDDGPGADRPPLGAHHDEADADIRQVL
jgi:hypothetical protein